MRSLAMTALVGAGLAHEPEDQQGAGTLLAEIICRGAGEHGSKAHCEALDQLGLQRGTSVETNHMRVSAIMVSDKLDDGLPLLLDMIRRPKLEDEALEPSRDHATRAIVCPPVEIEKMFDAKGEHFTTVRIVATDVRHQINGGRHEVLIAGMIENCLVGTFEELVLPADARISLTKV